MNSGFLEGIYALVHSSGRVLWPIPVQLKTSCKVDITLFPFDHQNCEIQFGSWIYQSDWIEYQFQIYPHDNSTIPMNWKHSSSELYNEMLMNHSKEYLNKEIMNTEENKCINNTDEDYLTKHALDTSSYWDSTDWMLIKASLSYTHRSTDLLTVWKPMTTPSITQASQNILTNHEKLNTKQTDLVLKLFVQRRSFFYVWNIVIPCVLLTSLTLITFWTPVDSGEKVTLGLSVFLAFSMFMMLIAERVPPTAKNIPLIGVYMTSVMTLTAGSVVVCVIVINLDSRGEKLTRAPKWIRRIIQLGIIRIFYEDENINKSATMSSIIEKLSIPYSNHENRLQKITSQISTLSELNQLLTKDKELTKEIQSAYRNYLYPSMSLKEKDHFNEPLSTTNNLVYHPKMNHLRTKFNTDDVDEYSLHNYLLPLIEVYDSVELLNENLNFRQNLITTNSNNNMNGNDQLKDLINLQKVEHELIKYEWKLIAKITDRLLFLTFVLITTVCYITIFVWPLVASPSFYYSQQKFN
ncbi:unnamed protein product [Heterobilharzia americana]|nr:unnamed protein product [Heterobilharzia americana]